MTEANEPQGKVALVTGSDSGIGQAIAEIFATAGADVAVTCYHDEAGAMETLRRVTEAGRRGTTYRLDVGNELEVAALFSHVDDVLGPPDILVNNAGIGGGGVPVVDMASEDFMRVLRTDLCGAFHCCREFLRRQAIGRPGKIINVTSVHEAIPSPANAAYGAAKGGLLTFTRSLALEAAPRHINVNAIAPGQIKTPMTSRTDDPEVYEEEMKHIPWHRPGNPEEVARLALYLASPASDYVTGQSFTIDGGLEMNWGQGA